MWEGAGRGVARRRRRGGCWTGLGRVELPERYRSPPSGGREGARVVSMCGFAVLRARPAMGPSPLALGPGRRPRPTAGSWVPGSGVEPRLWEGAGRGVARRRCRGGCWTGLGRVELPERYRSPPSGGREGARAVSVCGSAVLCGRDRPRRGRG
ncbi:hypothetical protein SMALA_1637 [Streptomyces malaysiensis subsp. malaysiensis]|nr:hypothetical protein SMALA_1637 [Streptomyces malaysiensis]